jgi:ribulose-phosphate 3-epimerase
MNDALRKLTNMEVEIIPAVMPRSLNDLEEHVSRVAGFVPWVQVDVMDGLFVRGKTWPYIAFDAKGFEFEGEGLPHWKDVDYEFDLMVKNPEKQIDRFVMFGASRVIFHIESTDAIAEAIALAREKELEVGLALNIDTPNEAIEKFISDIDFVQFMGISTIGLQGEPFDGRVIEKISSFRKKFPDVIISVDGGVSLDNALALTKAGANRLVAGSAIFKNDDTYGAIEELYNTANNAI